MSLLQDILEYWVGRDDPFLISPVGELHVQDLSLRDLGHLDDIGRGDVVALIGDLNAISIANFLSLVDRGTVVVPLVRETVSSHEYYFDSALVDWIVHDRQAVKRTHRDENSLLSGLRRQGNPGLVLFTTGTTGRPKAILHDMSHFLRRYRTPRPALRTLGFLQFDHIGGINTLLHTIFNLGTIVSPRSRAISDVLEAIASHEVQVLPTTPTFLRLMLLSDCIPTLIPKSLEVITYGTERMDSSTLQIIADLLPDIDLRQTYGMSELGILRVKSKSRDSLFMKVGGEGVETRVVDDVLEIRSDSRMVGYLNADDPFSADGWYRTGDVVETSGEYLKMIGRVGDVINVGGLKFMASDVERVIMEIPSVEFVKVTAKENPITGQHVEADIQLQSSSELDESSLRDLLRLQLPKHMMPRRLVIKSLDFSHRHKRL